MSVLVNINDYCTGCGDPIYDGEDVVWVADEPDEDDLSGASPYHQECQPINWGGDVVDQ